MKCKLKNFSKIPQSLYCDVTTVRLERKHCKMILPHFHSTWSHLCNTLLLRIIAQNRSEPSLHLCYAHSLSLRVIIHLEDKECANYCYISYQPLCQTLHPPFFSSSCSPFYPISLNPSLIAVEIKLIVLIKALFRSFLGSCDILCPKFSH